MRFQGRASVALGRAELDRARARLAEIEEAVAEEAALAARSRADLQDVVRRLVEALEAARPAGGS